MSQDIEEVRRLGRNGYAASRALAQAWDAAVLVAPTTRVYAEAKTGAGYYAGNNAIDVPRGALLGFVQHLIENPAVARVEVGGAVVYDISGLTE